MPDCGSIWQAPVDLTGHPARIAVVEELKGRSGWLILQRLVIESFDREELKDTKARINALNRQARLAATIREQHELQEKIRDMEKKKRRQRQCIFDIEDEITEKRDHLIEAMERRMRQKIYQEPLFTLRWEVA